MYRSLTAFLTDSSLLILLYSPEIPAALLDASEGYGQALSMVCLRVMIWVLSDRQSPIALFEF